VVGTPTIPPLGGNPRRPTVNPVEMVRQAVPVAHGPAAATLTSPADDAIIFSAADFDCPLAP